MVWLRNSQGEKKISETVKTLYETELPLLFFETLFQYLLQSRGKETPSKHCCEDACSDSQAAGEPADRKKLGTDKSNYSPLFFSGMPRGSPVIKSITFLRTGERN